MPLSCSRLLTPKPFYQPLAPALFRFSNKEEPLQQYLSKTLLKAGLFHPAPCILDCCLDIFYRLLSMLEALYHNSFSISKPALPRILLPSLPCSGLAMLRNAFHLSARIHEQVFLLNSSLSGLSLLFQLLSLAHS